MTAIAINESNSLYGFTNAVESLREAFVFPLLSWRSATRVVVILSDLRKLEEKAVSAAAEMREIFATCGKTCERIDDCHQSMLDMAIETRDALVDIDHSIAERGFPFGLISRRVRRALIEWDDLVEDLTLASDAEFQSLTAEISGLL